MKATRETTKQSVLKAQKKMKIRDLIIKRYKKEMEKMLKKQKASLPKTRKQTPKLFASIVKDIQKKESLALRQMTFKQLQKINALNELCYSQRFNLEGALDEAIAKVLSKTSATEYFNDATGKISKTDLQYLLNTHLEQYFLNKYAQYRNLKILYRPKITTTSLPKVSEHNIFVPTKVKGNHKKDLSQDVHIVDAFEGGEKASSIYE